MLLVCGRFCQALHRHEIFDLFNLLATPSSPDHHLRYNGTPTQDFAVCRTNQDGKRVVDRVRWGLIPGWSRRGPAGGGIINARAETLASKPSFRAAFRQRRCLIPANGWFEWQQTGTGKRPWFIEQESGLPTVFAGLWESWSGNGETLETFAIITRNAAAELAAIHHRQPVIVGRQDFATWLQAASDRQAIERILGDRPPRFVIWPVSKQVNNPRNDGPEILRPLNRPRLGSEQALDLA